MKKKAKKLLALLLTGSMLLTSIEPVLAVTGGENPASVTKNPKQILVCDTDLGDLSTPQSGTMHEGSYSWDPSTNTLVLDGIRYTDTTAPVAPDGSESDLEPLSGGLVSIDGDNSDSVTVQLKSLVTYDTQGIKSDAVYARNVSDLTVTVETLNLQNVERGIVNDTPNPSKLTVSSQGYVLIKQFQDYGILSRGDLSLNIETFRSYSLKHNDTPQACVASTEGSIALFDTVMFGCNEQDLLHAGKDILLDKSSCYGQTASTICYETITPEVYPGCIFKTDNGNITLTNKSFANLLCTSVAIVANGTGPDHGNFSAVQTTMLGTDGTPMLLKTSNDARFHGGVLIYHGTGTMMEVGGDLFLHYFHDDNEQIDMAGQSGLVYDEELGTELPAITEREKPIVTVNGNTVFDEKSIFVATTSRTPLQTDGDVTIKGESVLFQNQVYGSSATPDTLRTKGNLLFDTGEVRGRGMVKSEKAITFNKGEASVMGLQAKEDIRLTDTDSIIYNIFTEEDGIYSQSGDVIIQNSPMKITSKGYGIHTGNGSIDLSSKDLVIKSELTPVLAELHSSTNTGTPKPAVRIPLPLFAKDLKPACTPWQMELADNYCTKTVMVDETFKLPGDGLISNPASAQTKNNLLILQYADYSKVEEAVNKADALDGKLYKNFDSVTKAKGEIVYLLDDTHQEEVNAMAEGLNTAINNLVFKDADYTAVNEALSKIPADLSNFTEESVKTLQDKKDAVDYTKDIRKQDEVDRYAQDIEEAIRNLTLKGADYSKVDEALAKIPADLSIYTEKSVQPLLDAKNAVDRTKNITEQSTVDGYVEPILTALSGLTLKPADYTKVDQAIAAIPKDLSVYNKDSVKVLNDATEAVDRSKNITEQTTVDQYAEDIQTAIKGLVFLPADYSKVDEALNSIPADLSIYTKKSVKALNDATQTVDRSKNITQQKTVDQYAKDIKNAIKGLTLRPADYTRVDQAISAVPKDLSVYTPESVKVLKKAINQVDRSKKITEQKEVNQYAKAIRNATKKLVFLPADYTKVDEALNSIPTDLSVYTEESVKILNQAKQAVDRTKNKSEQKLVDQYATDIQNAVKGLIFLPADYTKVDKALSSIPADLSIYTKKSVSILNDAKQAVDRTKNITEQSEVDQYASNILGAVKGLNLRPADYTEVDQALAMIPKDLSVYTEESKKPLNQAVENVVRKKKITEQASVDQYAEEIRTATRGLVFLPADYAKVDEALKTIPTDLSIYTEESVQALNQAKQAMDRTKNITEQQAVDQYANRIQSAVKGLTLRPADYTKVDEALKTIPTDLSIYTEESLQVLNQAKQAVDRTKKITEQETVDQYANTIQSAVKGLILRPADYSKVDHAIALVNSLDRELYENFELAENAVAHVDRTKNITEQKIVDQYAEDILDAINHLKAIPKPEESTSSLIVSTPESGVLPKVEGVSKSLIRTVEQQRTDVKIIGGTTCAGVISATQNGNSKTLFTQPFTVTVPLSNEAETEIENPKNLTLALVKPTSDGSVTLEYMGGRYDAKTGLFTAKVDEAGTYLLVSKPGLTKIVLTIDRTDLFLNDRKTVIDVAPLILNGRTMVPIRFISEAFSCKVDWDEATRSVTIQEKEKFFRMTVGREIPGYGQAPVIRNSRTLVPLRYISETLGANVIYDPFERQVLITR